MAYDIYGNILEKGYCEVHPGVPEEYPCYMCLKNSQQSECESKQYDEYCSRQFEEYCKELAKEQPAQE